MKKKPTTKICKYCKAEIPFDAKVCPHCRKNPGGGCLSVFIVFIVIASIGSCFGKHTNPKTDSAATAIETTATAETTEAKETLPLEETTAALTDKEKFIVDLTGNPDVTGEAAESTYNILTEQLGFENIEVKSNSMGTLFDVTADGYPLKVTVSDKLYMVICGDYNLYKDDSVQYTKPDLDNRKIGKNDSAYYAMAMEAVSSVLKDPSSARFCSMGDCQMGRNGEYVVVKGYVDAINSFGSQLRNDFVVELKVSDVASYSYETVYLNINGESTGNYVDIK